MALLLLCPQIPLLFMGEESGAIAPFLFFADFQGELGAAVSQGRRREFANAPGFAAVEATSSIPDPNDPATFEASRFSDSGDDAAEWRALVKALLALRHRHIIPHLAGSRAAGATVAGSKAVVASWQLGNGTALVLACNLDGLPASAELPCGEPLFGHVELVGEIPPLSTLAWIKQ
jgi:maltooligosyltrehalose trehalohydrolase